MRQTKIQAKARAENRRVCTQPCASNPNIPLAHASTRTGTEHDQKPEPSQNTSPTPSLSSIGLLHPPPPPIPRAGAIDALGLKLSLLGFGFTLTLPPYALPTPDTEVAAVEDETVLAEEPNTFEWAPEEEDITEEAVEKLRACPYPPACG